MSNPLQGTAGKPLVGVPGPNDVFVGRIIIELFEDPHKTVDANERIADDAKGIALIVSPGLDSNVTQEELLRRLALAFPVRAAHLIKVEEKIRKIAEEKGEIY